MADTAVEPPEYGPFPPFFPARMSGVEIKCTDLMNRLSYPLYTILAVIRSSQIISTTGSAFLPIKERVVHTLLNSGYLQTDFMSLAKYGIKTLQIDEKWIVRKFRLPSRHWTR